MEKTGLNIAWLDLVSLHTLAHETMQKISAAIRKIDISLNNQLFLVYLRMLLSIIDLKFASQKIIVLIQKVYRRKLQHFL